MSAIAKQIFCKPPDHLRDYAEERRVTREVIGIIGELPDDDYLTVRDGDLVVPEDDDVPEELRRKIRELEPYLLWAAGLPATHWLSGGPAHIPEAA